MLGAIGEILAHIDHELIALTAETKSGAADADSVFQRIKALSKMIDRCVMAH